MRPLLKKPSLPLVNPKNISGMWRFQYLSSAPFSIVKTGRKRC
jgi:hypothetical protein